MKKTDESEDREMDKKAICKWVTFGITTMLLAGMCCAGEPDEKAPLQRYELFEKKIQQANDKYGFMSTGTATVEIKSDYGTYIWPEEIADHSEGILFMDVHDYDGDGDDELLLLRRQEGYANIEYVNGASAPDRHEYCFEMYEYSELRQAYLSSRFVAGVFDIYDLFTGEASAIVFLRDKDGKADIFMETYKRMQDHPQNISLIHLNYDGSKFVDYSGFRYGCLFWGDDCMQFQQFKSLAAFDFLSYPAGANDPNVDVIASADTEEDEVVAGALQAALAEYGLALRDKEDSEDQDTGTENKLKEDLDELMDHSALGGYQSDGGVMRALGYVAVCNAGAGSEAGYENVEFEQYAYTPDPEGIDRASLGEE